ncbi:BglG family transcription antiterminator [Paraliobacillus salinarum]|uniref:BglG family transcription antiterminator n=1 Tax=Paraliobacillus salinarum TaxID=1158996 RepID=UPI0015F65101|nr:BglG family transcription antiterminator [Paraliobacillus salinarum]
MKAVNDMISNREKKIIKFLIESGHTRVKDIADYFHLSEKTVSKLLKEIESYLRKFKVSLVRKPRVGVFIEGNYKSINRVLSDLSTRSKSIPSTKEERVVYIYSQLLKTQGYVTMQKLSDELFISKDTIEKDVQEVEKILKEEEVFIYKKPSKGMKLNITESEKRALTSKFINYFWGGNWYLKHKEDKFSHEFDTIQADVQGLFSEKVLKQIIEIVREFTITYDFQFTDYAFQSFVIHLAITVERIKNGSFINIEKNTSLEHSVLSQHQNTIRIVNLLEKSLSITIPKFEIYYINIHLTAAYNQCNERLLKHTHQVPNNDLRNFVENCLSDQYDRDLIEGITTHMKSVINRLKLGMHINNPYVNKIKQNFLLSFEKALFLKKQFEKKYNISINDDETAYIALHFEAFQERIRILPDQLNVVIVCSTGLGSSRLLAARIKKYFPDIRIQKVLSVQEMMTEHIDTDLIISTIHLKVENVATVVVSPIMNQIDLNVVQNKIKTLQKEQKTATNMFIELIKKENILVNLQSTTMKEAIIEIGEHLIDKGFAESSVIQSALDREELSFTSFNSMATPHANPKYIKKSTIVVATLLEPIQWGDELVNKVFFIALEKDNQLDLDDIYDNFFEFIDNKKRMNELDKADNSDQIYKCLKREGI